MLKHTVSIIVWNNMAYFPTQCQTEAGFFVDCEPVISSSPNINGMMTAVQDSLKRGHPQIPTPERHEWKEHESVILKATGARSWKALAKNGRAFGIDWTDQNIILEIDRVDSKGRWEPDLEKRREFPLDTPLENILSLVLEEWGI